MTKLAENCYFKNMSDNQAKIKNFVSSIHYYSDEVGDILQETNLTLLKKRDDFDSSRDFLPWAFSIARFTLMAFKKKRARHLSKVSYGAESLYEFLVDENVGDKVLHEIEQERIYLIQIIRSKLGSKYLIFFDKMLDGKSPKQMSKETGYSMRDIYSYRRRTVNKAKKILSKYNESK
tara:strand:- start:4686 stop:5216 length:531 start_codon:yes stop_codon:yes gene_type:complete